MRKNPVPFCEDVTQRFEFLDQYGFSGSEYDDEILPSARYVESGLSLHFFLHNDSRDSAVSGSPW